jgi:hypothetical protein
VNIVEEEMENNNVVTEEGEKRETERVCGEEDVVSTGSGSPAKQLKEAGRTMTQSGNPSHDLLLLDNHPSYLANLKAGPLKLTAAQHKPCQSHYNK